MIFGEEMGDMIVDIIGVDIFGDIAVQSFAGRFIGSFVARFVVANRTFIIYQGIYSTLRLN